jgi:hypothetical protein
MDSLTLWKQLGDSRRLAAGNAFYSDSTLKELHKAADAFIARVKNFRPQFVRRLPVEKRTNYLANLPITSDLASQLLVSYHFAHHRPMMSAFLDALKVPNQDGLIKEDIEMSRPTDADLEVAVNAIRQSFSNEDVDLYLLTLQTQNPDVWGGLARHVATAAA